MNETDMIYTIVCAFHVTVVVIGLLLEDEFIVCHRRSQHVAVTRMKKKKGSDIRLVRMRLFAAL